MATNKKERNWRRAHKKMKPKTKAKVKKAREIERRNKRNDSKKQASLEMSKKPVKSKVSRGAKQGDAESKFSAVDKLFATIGEGEEEENAEPLDDGSDSSAGEFQDIGGDDVDSDHADLDDEEDVLDGQKHAEELKVMREKDPEFYKFLLDSDKDLLQFEAPKGDEESEETSNKFRRVCTMERLRKIQSSAEQTYTALKASMHIFNSAVRSLEGWHEEEDLKREQGHTEWESGQDEKWKKKRVRTFHLEVDDEAVFSAAIEWSLANQLKAFDHHAGTLLDAPATKWTKKMPRKVLKQELAEARKKPENEEEVVDPSRYSNWQRLQIMNRIFWQDIGFLLSKVSGPMQHSVLRSISTPHSISWLWPLRTMRTMLLKKATTIWSSADSQTSRMLAFLFLRNTGVMTMKLEEPKALKVPLLDEIIKLMVKGFAKAASMGFSWKSHSTFRFLENCFVEVMRVDNATAYRQGYACIRQLAMVLRNSSIAVTHGEGKKTGQAKQMALGRKVKGSTDKQAKKRAYYDKALKALIAWPFVRAMYLWTKVVGALPALRDLAFPLSMVILGAAKSSMAKVQNFPFVFHCLLCQNKLGTQLEVYVPISSHIIKCWTVLTTAMEKAHKKRRSISGTAGTGLASTKAPDLEVLCHFREWQMQGPALDAVGHNLHFLLVDHMGILSRSPAFPELASIVLTHIRRIRKKCRSYILRRELTSFITAAEATAEDLRAKRDALTEAPTFSKFFLFPPDTAMAKMRETLLKQKADDEKHRIEVELQKKENDKKDGDRKSGTKTKRERQKERRAREKAEKKAKAAEPKKKRRKVLKLGKGTDDTVEEMHFSDGED